MLRDINVSANLLVKSVPVVQMHMDRVGTVRRPGRLTPALLGDSAVHEVFCYSLTFSL